MRRIIRVPVGLRLLRHDGDVSAASAACVTGCDSARRCEAARIVQVFTAASLGKSAFKVGQAEVAPSNLRKASTGEALGLGSVLFGADAASVQCAAVHVTPEALSRLATLPAPTSVPQRRELLKKGAWWQELRRQVESLKLENKALKFLLDTKYQKISQQKKIIKHCQTKSSRASNQLERFKSVVAAGLQRECGGKKFEITRAQTCKMKEKKLNQLQYLESEEGAAGIEDEEPLTGGWLTPQGTIASALRRNLTNGAAQDLGLVLLQVHERHVQAEESQLVLRHSRDIVWFMAATDGGTNETYALAWSTKAIWVFLAASSTSTACCGSRMLLALLQLTMAMIANTLRDSSQTLFASWRVLCDDESAVARVKTLFPRYIAERWGSIDLTESRMLKADISCLSQAVSRMFQVSPELTAHNDRGAAEGQDVDALATDDSENYKRKIGKWDDDGDALKGQERRRWLKLMGRDNRMLPDSDVEFVLQLTRSTVLDGHDQEDDDDDNDDGDDGGDVDGDDDNADDDEVDVDVDVDADFDADAGDNHGRRWRRRWWWCGVGGGGSGW
ncbi:unnamed protein product [Symbiodinium microadriaticum]|nr:unnamed protein product [Symbiodinium microadriaticum]